MNLHAERTSAAPPLIEGNHDFGSLTDLVCGLVERPTPRWWWLAFLVCGTVGLLGGALDRIRHLDRDRRLGHEPDGGLGRSTSPPSSSGSGSATRGP